MKSMRRPIETVREAVADREQVQPVDLPEISADVDAAILAKLTGPWADVDRALEFTFVWYHVTVHPTGEVTLGD